MAGQIEFDWDEENTKHLAGHKVTRAEFEQVIMNDPVDIAYEWIGDEERYRSVGVADSGRLLSVVWTIRGGKVRGITAFAASASDKKAFQERCQ